MDEEQLRGKAFTGQADVVLAAMDAEPDLITRAGVSGSTLLHDACRWRVVDVARGLLDRKAAVEGGEPGPRPIPTELEMAEGLAAETAGVLPELREDEDDANSRPQQSPFRRCE